VTQDGVLAAREDGREPVPPCDRHRVADRVDTAMDGLQASRGNALRDAPIGEADVAKLAARDDPVLPSSERRDTPVRRG
jgi:hypothetical protein